jgi:hypothetical protein
MWHLKGLSPPRAKSNLSDTEVKAGDAVKQPWHWDENDVQQLIRSGVTENLTLDYKSSGALAKTDRKKDEISKDVSAFANSAGGTILYGVTERDHFPYELDEGFDPNDISKEWLEQVINSRIQRRIDGIRINQVPLSSHPGRVLYVVHIPQSDRGPHMASDHVFYKRFNFVSVPMEEYEVRDVSRRGAAPDLQLQALLAGGPEVPLTYQDGAAFSDPIGVQFVITNYGEKPAEYSLVMILVDKRLSVNATSLQRAGEELANVADLPFEMVVYHKKLLVPSSMPIWNGVHFKLTDDPMEICLPRESGAYLISWTISSPGMVSRKNVMSLRSWGDSVFLEEVQHA